MSFLSQKQLNHLATYNPCTTNSTVVQHINSDEQKEEEYLSQKQKEQLGKLKYSMESYNQQTIKEEKTVSWISYLSGFLFGKK